MRAQQRSRRANRALGPTVVVAAIVSLLAVALPGAVLAQDESAAPSAMPDPSEAPVADPVEERPAPAFPSTLLGQDLDVLTYSGPEWIAEFESGSEADRAYVDGTKALLESVGKSIDDLIVSSALHEPSPDDRAVIAALRIDGTDARDFSTEAVRLMLGDVTDPEFALRPLQDRWVLRVVDAALPGVYPRTVYLHEDTAWIIGGDEPYVEDLVGQLPEQSLRDDSTLEPLVTRVPGVLDDRRRTGLYESIEPLFMPTLSERFERPLDQWLVDAYLDAGYSPLDLYGVIAWWGIGAPEESVQIEGYQVPGGSAELLDRLLDEVMLAEGAALLTDVARTDGQIGGHDVSTLDYGTAKQHFFVAGDTLWVVTDHVGEPTLAEEAIAALS